MFRTSFAAALFALVAGGAVAQSIESQVRQQLRAQGFHAIEVERDDGQIEVDARRGGLRIELKYDARTGRLISQRSHRIDHFRPGVSRPGVGVWRINDDDDDDGRGRGRGYRGDDDDDDDRGRGGRSRGGHDNDDDD